MAYVVLARKWRSKHFKEVVGQGHVARTLENSIDQDRVAHAYLFCGARGVGKTSTARILAKALNCIHGPTKTPCYACASCLEVSQGRALDVFEIDGASNRGINEIRELRESATYTPSRDRFKIYIIDEVHMLTTEAFNALLKILEEPPPHVKFIFATTEPQKIPVTILSRCQRFDFKRITQADIVDHLHMIAQAEAIQAEEEGLQLIARQAAGGMRDALSLLDQVISFAGKTISAEQVTKVLGVANRAHLFAMSHAIVGKDPAAALLALDEVHRYGYDLNHFAKELIEHFRDLTVIKVVQDPSRVTSLTRSELDSVAPLVAATSVDLLHRLFGVLVEGAERMSRSAYPKLLFEMTLVRLCSLEPMVAIDLMIDKLRDLEDLLDPGQEVKKKTEPRPLVSPHVPHPPPPSTLAQTPAPSAPSAPPRRPTLSGTSASPPPTAHNPCCAQGPLSSTPPPPRGVPPLGAAPTSPKLANSPGPTAQGPRPSHSLIIPARADPAPQARPCVSPPERAAHPAAAPHTGACHAPTPHTPQRWNRRSTSHQSRRRRRRRRSTPRPQALRTSPRFRPARPRRRHRSTWQHLAARAHGRRSSATCAAGRRPLQGRLTMPTSKSLCPGNSRWRFCPCT